MKRLQGEPVKLQDWLKDKGLSVVMVCEERNADGKGGVIKRITECVSPRTNCVVALPEPSERGKTQMFTQRYISHFPLPV